ncbi:MAG: heme-binding domain-containing protein [Flavobacteriales bacterium]
MKTIIKITVGIILLGFIIQLYPIDRSVKPIPKSYDIIRQENASKLVADLITNACYDCHSNETQYPEYASYAPVSWYIEYHVEEGRKNANFSRWKKYDTDQKNSILQNCIETLNDNSMPLKSYISKHPEATLSIKERQLLVEWFQGLVK